MTVSDFQVEGYRSLKYLNLRLKRVNVVVGPNGCGKSNLYKSLNLLQQAAAGRLAKTLADEGGMPSVLWAGPRLKGPVRMKFALKLESGLKYEIACGLPVPGSSPFAFDPQVKEEHVSVMNSGEKTVVLDRKGQAVNARNTSGKKVLFPEVAECESVLSELKEPQLFPKLHELRQEILSWRFYHKFRTDESSALRQEQAATRTMCLAHDGADLASALRTIEWVGDREALAEAVKHAFGGASIAYAERSGKIMLQMQMPGLSRALDACELSDGTLHYLCLLAALLSPRPAKMIALNEPEASMHPDLLAPLADLVALASKQSQIWIITHSFELANLISERSFQDALELEKHDGATRIKGQLSLL